MIAALLLPAFGLRRGRDPLEALALGGAVGILLWGAVGLARFFFWLPPGGSRTVGLATLPVGTALAFLLAWRYGRQPAPVVLGHPVPRRLLGVIAGTAALTLGLAASLPHYDLAGRFFDWYMHFDLARFYEAATNLGRQYPDGSVPTRTPLFNLLGAVALTAMGDRFSVFQVFTAALGWLWVLPFALLARRLLGSRATGVVALAGLSPLILFAHTYPWSKGLVAFWALLGLERLLTLRDAASGEARPMAMQMGLCSGAVAMTHPGFVGYPLALFALLAWDVWHRRRAWAELVLATVMAALVAIPWSAWAITQYGWQQAIFSYPRTPSASIVGWVFDRFVILVSSIVPINAPIDRLTTTLNPLEDYFLVYLGTAAGLAGVVFLVRAMAQNLRRESRFRVGRQEWPILGFAAGGMVVGALLLEGLVENDAASFCIPGLLGLLLLAAQARPISRSARAIAIAESMLLLAVVLAWTRFPASAGQNAQLATMHGTMFLGAAMWPIGLLLAMAGAAACIGLTLGFGRYAEPAQPVEGAGTPTRRIA